MDSSVGSVFLPLRRCNKRKVPDIVEVDRDSSNLGGFREFKASDKAAATVHGRFSYGLGFFLVCFIS